LSKNSHTDTKFDHRYVTIVVLLHNFRYKT